MLTLTGDPNSRPIPSRPSQLRKTNARALLRLLKVHNPCSKADLVRFSGLSAPTVSSGVHYLHSLGLVEHLGDGESSGGRPPGLLRFNTRAGYVAAADVGGTRLRMMLADLGGNILAEASSLLGPLSRTPESIADLIDLHIKSMCRKAAIPLKSVMHLTAGAPGVTNVRTGVVLSAPNLEHWDHVPFQALLEERTRVPTLIENDTNLAAIGESWRGAAQGIQSFIFIALETGVGAGVYLNGQIYRGARWSAGEIGYFGVPGKGREFVSLRAMGQLESLIGGSGIELEWHTRLRRRDFPHVQSALPITPTGIFDRAEMGDDLSIEVLEWVGELLVAAIVDIVLLLNPEVVVLGGGVGSHPALCRVTRRLLRRNDFDQPDLRSSALGTCAQLYGALTTSLQAVEANMLQELQTGS